MRIRSSDDSLVCGSCSPEAVLDRPDSGGVLAGDGRLSVVLALLRGMGGFPLGAGLARPSVVDAGACLTCLLAGDRAGGLSIAADVCAGGAVRLALTSAAHRGASALHRAPVHAPCAPRSPGCIRTGLVFQLGFNFPSLTNSPLSRLGS